MENTLKPITIQIRSVKTSSSNPKNNNNTRYDLKELLRDQIEINKEYIGFFYGCWIKCINKKTGKYIPGGFLTKMSPDSSYVILRPINNPENTEVYLKNHVFYVKRDTEQYLGMQKIMIEKEKLDFEFKKLSKFKKNIDQIEKNIKHSEEVLKKERYDFDNLSYKFYKIFREGKVKFIE